MWQNCKNDGWELFKKFVFLLIYKFINSSQQPIQHIADAWKDEVHFELELELKKIGKKIH